MKFFVVLFITAIFSASFSSTAEFNKNDPTTWNENHKIAARFAYCGEVIREICPFNVKKGNIGNVLVRPKHPCPFFTDKLTLAEQLFSERLSEKQNSENLKLERTLKVDIQRARTMKQLDIPFTAYDNCQNDVEEFLKENYKPTFDLKTFND